MKLTLTVEFTSASDVDEWNTVGLVAARLGDTADGVVVQSEHYLRVVGRHLSPDILSELGFTRSDRI